MKRLWGLNKIPYGELSVQWLAHSKLSRMIPKVWTGTYLLWLLSLIWLQGSTRYLLGTLISQILQKQSLRQEFLCEMSIHKMISGSAVKRVQEEKKASKFTSIIGNWTQSWRPPKGLCEMYFKKHWMGTHSVSHNYINSISNWVLSMCHRCVETSFFVVVNQTVVSI